MSAQRSASARFVHRPDASIKMSSDGKYRGVGVYNATGMHQTRTVKAKRTTTKTFVIAVRNAGSAGDGFRLLVVLADVALLQRAQRRQDELRAEPPGEPRQRTRAPALRASIIRPRPRPSRVGSSHTAHRTRRSRA